MKGTEYLLNVNEQDMEDKPGPDLLQLQMSPETAINIQRAISLQLMNGNDPIYFYLSGNVEVVSTTDEAD